MIRDTVGAEIRRMAEINTAPRSTLRRTLSLSSSYYSYMGIRTEDWSIILGA